MIFQMVCDIYFTQHSLVLGLCCELEYQRLVFICKEFLNCIHCSSAGPKPLKCFTPPPDYKPESGSSEDDRSSDEDEDEEDEEDEDVNDGVVRSSVKAEDEFLKAVSFL